MEKVLAMDELVEKVLAMDALATVSNPKIWTIALRLLSEVEAQTVRLPSTSFVWLFLEKQILNEKIPVY